MTKYLIFPMLLILAGCAETNRSYDTDGGSSGEGSTLSGGQGSTVANEIGGTSAGTSVGTSVGTVGTSTGGSAPNVGGNASTGGTVASTGGATTGTGGVSAVCTTPVTCEDVAAAANISSTVSDAAACGFISDGCGGMLDCGACASDGAANTGCGEQPNTNGYDWSGYGVARIPNICGTRCIKNSPYSNSADCTQFGANQDGWYCPSSVPPLGVTGCNKISNRSFCCSG